MGKFPMFAKCPDCEEIFKRNRFSPSGTYRVVCRYCDNKFFIWEDGIKIFRVEPKWSRGKKFVEVSEDPSVESRLKYMRKIAERILQ